MLTNAIRTACAINIWQPTDIALDTWWASGVIRGTSVKWRPTYEMLFPS